MTKPAVDFWFDFASTYSYLAAARIRTLAADMKVAITFRPFLLGPIFKTQGWDTSPFNLYPAKGRYMWRDLERQCADQGLPLKRPDPFPQHSVLAARVALIGLGQDWGDDFCVNVFRAQFGEGRSISEPATLAAVLADLNVVAEPVLAAAQADDNKARLRTQTEDAARYNIFGAPSFTTSDGELFWGNDRLEQALAWARRLG
ncbi:MAG TPA: 2-hydroxychromene-2-carboxylate isomerase [Xanthobacteraceae bacterium]|jgi:2-hydroxychromene-2-carboxylate isomerase|nr:2-hydroxychromene-2-carboxylate isomerase [Xanthobacteraceae bacterium]